MSFPVAKPDRRLLARSRLRDQQPCTVQFAPGDSAPAILRQLDLQGAQVRLLGHISFPTDDLRILTEDGQVVVGAAAWRIDDVMGVRRRFGSTRRRRAFDNG